MKIDEIIIENYEWADETLLSFEVLPTDELISAIDGIRYLSGYKDLASDKDNDVWYNFYLDVNLQKETLDLWGQCNNGKDDDYAQYDVGVDIEDKIKLLWKAFRQFAKESERWIR